MSTYDPSSPEPEEGGGKPSFDKQPPQPGSPYDAPPPAAGSPYDAPPAATGSPYDAPPPPAGPYGGGGPYGVPPGGPGAPPPYGAPQYPNGPYAGAPGMAAPAIVIGSWPKRILARLVDYLIVQVIAFVVVLPFTGFGSRDGWTGGVWLFYGLYLIYEGVMLSRDGQTLGKKLMKVRVAMLADGSSPVGSGAWTRAAVFTLPAVLCCGLWWVVDGLFGVFDKPYRQCLHDKAAKTVVVVTD